MAYLSHSNQLWMIYLDQNLFLILLLSSLNYPQFHLELIFSNSMVAQLAVLSLLLVENSLLWPHRWFCLLLVCVFSARTGLLILVMDLTTIIKLCHYIFCSRWWIFISGDISPFSETPGLYYLLFRKSSLFKLCDYIFCSRWWIFILGDISPFSETPVLYYLLFRKSSLFKFRLLINFYFDCFFSPILPYFLFTLCFILTKEA